MTKIRVLVNGLHARSGGGVTYLKNILPALAEHSDLELHLFLHDSQYEVIGKVDDRIRIHLLNFKPGIAYLLAWEQICLPILARLMSVDVTFSPANYGPLLTPGSVILLRNALSVVGRETRPLKRLYWLVLSFMTLLSLACCRRAAAVSNFASKTLTFGFDRFMKDRLSVIYHGVSSSYAPRLSVPAGQPFLLVVADIYIQKNLHTLIEAFRLVLREHPTMELVIAGRKIDGDYYEELVDQIHKGRIGALVRFVDSLPAEKLVELYQGCKVFVFPSTVETFGNPLVEAMACGAPIACSSSAAMPEIVGDCAEFFDPVDKTQMANAVLRLLSDPDRRAQLAGRGLLRARRFSWPESASQIADVFRLCARRAASTGDDRVDV